MLQKQKNRWSKTIGWPKPVMDHRKKRKKIILHDLSWFETILWYFGFFDMKALWETLSKEKNMSITQSDFFSNLLYLCVNFPVLYKYKNMELTLKKIWIWTALGCVFGDFSLDFPWFGLLIYKLQTLHFWTRMTLGRSSLDFHFSWPI